MLFRSILGLSQEFTRLRSLRSDHDGPTLQGERCKHCSWCNVYINALYLFLDDCLIGSSPQGHGRGKAVQLRELTSHTRLAPAIIKGYLLWWEKRRYDCHLFHRNLNEITRSSDFGRVCGKVLHAPKQYQNEKRTLILI